jgi:hypothetical protein
MCNGCIHEQKNYNGQIQHQTQVCVFQDKSPITDTGYMYTYVCVCVYVFSVHSGYGENKISKIGTQCEYDYIHFSSNHFI